MDYSIGEFSRLTGLGVHTLRYYEQEQLLTPSRNAGNRRRYSEQDRAWVGFILRLKETGMPLKEIRQYAALRAAGDQTLSERLDLLLLHSRRLDAAIEQLREHQALLSEKIEFYRTAIQQLPSP